MNYKLQIAIILSSAVVGALVVKKFSPTIVSQDHEVIKDRIVTVTHTMHTPDGTTTTDQTSTEDKTTDSLRLTTAAPNWVVSAGLLNTDHSYTVLLQRRIFANAFIGVSAGMTGVTLQDGFAYSHNAGLWLGMEF